jgi:hypothetical protein
MARLGTVMPAHLHRRMCLSCGFDGRALQGEGQEGIWVCPKCGSDLYARPPRSYAELEALSDSNSTPWIVTEVITCSRPREKRSFIVPSRWFIYSNVVMVSLLLLASIGLLAIGAMLGRAL